MGCEMPECVISQPCPAIGMRLRPQDAEVTAEQAAGVSEEPDTVRVKIAVPAVWEPLFCHSSKSVWGYAFANKSFSTASYSSSV